MANNESEINIGMNIEADTALLTQGLSKTKKEIKTVAIEAEKIPENIEKATEASKHLEECTKKTSKVTREQTSEIIKQAEVQKEISQNSKSNLDNAKKRKKTEQSVTQEIDKQQKTRKKNADTSKEIVNASNQETKKTRDQIALEKQKLRLKEQQLKSKTKNTSSSAYSRLVDITEERKNIKNEEIISKTKLANARRKQIEQVLDSRFTPTWAGGLASATTGISSRFKGKAGVVGISARIGEQVSKKRIFESGVISGKGVKTGGIIGGVGVLAITKLGKALFDLSKSALEAFGSIEKLKTSLGVVFNSEVQANTTFQDIKEYAVKSPFGAEQTTEMAILLKQSGIYGYELLDTLKMIGDVSGGNEEKMKRIANNYAQIASIGKASMLDMRQFAYAGIPIYKAVAEELGVSQQVLRNMIADGKVTNDVMEKVFKNLTSESGLFYKATEKGAETLNARLTNLKDAANFAFAGLGQVVMNIGDKRGEGGLITGLIGTAENILHYLEGFVNTVNLEKAVNKIEKNNAEQVRLKTLIEMSEDNPELKKYLETQLKEVQGFISNEERLALESEKYYKERERLQELIPVSVQSRAEHTKKEKEIIKQKRPYDVEMENRSLTSLYSDETGQKRIQELEKKLNMYDAELKILEEREKRFIDINKYQKEMAENEEKYGLSASYVAAQNFTTTQMEMISKSSDRATGLSVVAGNAVLAWEQNTEEGRKQKQEKEDKEYAENYRRFTEYKKALTDSGNLVQGFKGSLSDFYEILQSGIIKPLETIDLTKLAEESAKNDNQKLSRDNQWKFLGDEIGKIKKLFGSELTETENDKLSRMLFILNQNNNKANVDAFATIFRGFVEDLEKSGNKELAAAIGQALIYVKEIPEWMPEKNPTSSKAKGKDGIPELWKRIVGAATGIDASFISGGAKSFFEMYRSTFEQRNLAQGGISGMTAAGKSTAEISTMLRYNGKTSKDGTLQIDWEATAEVMKDFMLSGKSSVKELEEYTQAIEGQISVYDKLKETMFTTGEDWENIDPKILEEQLVNAFSGVGANLVAINKAGQQREVEVREGNLYFKGTKDLVYAQNEYKMSLEKSIEAVDEASVSLKKLSLEAQLKLADKQYIEKMQGDVYSSRLSLLGLDLAKSQNLPVDAVKPYIENYLEEFKIRESEGASIVDSEIYKKQILGTSFQGDFSVNILKYLHEKGDEELKEKILDYVKAVIDTALVIGTPESKMTASKYLSFLYETDIGKNKVTKGVYQTGLQYSQKEAISQSFYANQSYFKEFDRMSKEIKKAQADGDVRNIGEPLRLRLLELAQELKGISFEDASQKIKEDLKIRRSEMSKWDWQGQTDINIQEGALTGDLGMYSKGSFASAGLSLLQGTDAGAFVQGMAQGGPVMGLINMVVNALTNIVGSMDILSYALSPVTQLLKGFSLSIKTALVPLAVVAQLMGMLGEVIASALKFIYGLFGIEEDEIDEYFSNLTGANNELEKQAELLKTLNNQFEETLKAFKQAEEYYLIERQHQDAVRAIEFQGGFPTDTRKVNDMILTPHGNFSTAPDDFLLAMKDPTMLMKNNVGEIQTVVNVQVINNAGNIVTTTATESINEKGQKELVVMISRAVANDYASGRNGWDSAISSRNIRARGRNY